ncbi:MAG: trypsin-like serine protease [Deltaproteobacteria bacterium]|nr:trypsin-like serine protease [Deltaproteobacteria bacterium]
MQQQTTTAHAATTTTPTTRLGERVVRATVLVLAAGVTGCVADLGVDDAPTALTMASKDEHPVIVGAVDWQDAALLPEGTAERANANAVAYLDLPAAGSRCTGFLIAPDVLMTNEHCIPDARAAMGARALFRYETGSANVAAFDCSTFLGNDAGLDFALLQCAGRPGGTFGVVSVEHRAPRRNEPVYVLHQNCDHHADASCAPTKKLSPGRVRAVGTETGHDADTLGGSSGSPLFSRDTHAVIGLHHVGVGGTGNGRGTVNRAVPMTRILPVLAQRFPGLTLGGSAPATTPPAAPAPTTTDGYEPNDTLSGATPLALPFSGTARIDAGDRDVYAFDGDGTARTLALSLTHQTGDLDLYAYDAAGNLLARSNGVTNSETITSAFRGAVRVVVVGYGRATGNYALSVR